MLFLAINYWTLDDALANMGDVSRKVILDATNPYEYNSAGKVVRSIPTDISGGELLQQKLPHSKVIKVFSSMMATVMNERHHRKPLLVMPYTTNFTDEKQRVESLVSDAGFLPMYYGDLTKSKPIELFGKYSDKILNEQEAVESFKIDFEGK